VKKASVVIGANFGDEGKGLITDYLSSPNSLVVRFNGGAQAGHTVVTPDGIRHVFSHFASGSLRGAHSFLSRFFIANPVLFVKEFSELTKKVSLGNVFIDPKCILTTPYDMMLNHIDAGNRSHGTCGVGINETVKRNERPEFSLKYQDTFFEDELRSILSSIRYKYMPQRLAELDQKIPENLIHDELILERFINDIKFMQRKTQMSCWGAISNIHEKQIFEGAQGLQLDEDHHFFPHVTRSKTGLDNVITLANEAGIEELQVNYVSRIYATRHGNGPLANEDDTFPEILSCKTNLENEYQGKFRYGLLEMTDMVSGIMKDLNRDTRINLQPRFALTHLDQCNDKISFCRAPEERVTMPMNEFIRQISRAIDSQKNVDTALVSKGPTRNDVNMESLNGY